MPDSLPPEQPLEPVDVVGKPSLVARMRARLGRMRPIVVAIAGVGAVVGGLVGYLNAYRAFTVTERHTEAVSPGASARKASENSIAVLPFVDSSPGHEGDYFSDGLAEQLIELLVKFPELQVTSRASSFRFKGKSDDIEAIARKLNVAYILTGTMQRLGKRLRVSVQLVRAATGEGIWAETFDREWTDVFELQDEIASAVVAGLKIRLSQGQKPVATRLTSNDDAYVQYMLGRQFLGRANHEGYARAVSAFKRAISLDPRFAAAYAGLSGAEVLVSEWDNDAEAMQRGAVAAERALALAPELAEGYLARGRVRLLVNWDWSGALSDYEHALSIDPGSGGGHRDRGWILAIVGRWSEALVDLERAAVLDPLTAGSWSRLSQVRLVSGDAAGARSAANRAVEVQPESALALLNLGIFQLLAGELVDARSTFARIDDTGYRLAAIAMAEHALNHHVESQRALEESIAKNGKDSAFQIAEAFAWRGETEKAFEWLERAMRQRDGGLLLLKIDPLLNSLRTDARFSVLVAKLNLPQ